MEIRVKTTGFEATREISAYLDEKVSAIEKLLGEDSAAARCEVEMGRDGHMRHGEHVWFAEMNVIYPGGSRVRATNHEPTLNAAIDAVKEEVVRQLRKQRRTHTRLLRRGGAILKRLMRLQ